MPSNTTLPEGDANPSPSLFPIATHSLKSPSRLDLQRPSAQAFFKDIAQAMKLRRAQFSTAVLADDAWNESSAPLAAFDNDSLIPGPHIKDKLSRRFSIAAIPLDVAKAITKRRPQFSDSPPRSLHKWEVSAKPSGLHRRLVFKSKSIPIVPSVPYSPSDSDYERSMSPWSDISTPSFDSDEMIFAMSSDEEISDVEGWHGFGIPTQNPKASNVNEVHIERSDLLYLDAHEARKLQDALRDIEKGKNQNASLKHHTQKNTQKVSERLDHQNAWVFERMDDFQNQTPHQGTEGASFTALFQPKAMTDAKESPSRIKAKKGSECTTSCLSTLNDERTIFDDGKATFEEVKTRHMAHTKKTSDIATKEEIEEGTTKALYVSTVVEIQSPQPVQAPVSIPVTQLEQSVLDAPVFTSVVDAPIDRRQIIPYIPPLYAFNQAPTLPFSQASVAARRFASTWLTYGMSLGAVTHFINPFKE